MGADQKPTLTWASAAKIAWRELQASRAKFLFVILSVAIGVAALTGVRGFSDSFQKTLLGEARTIMAADLSARMFRQPTQQEEQQLNALASRGIERTEVSDMVSMVSSPGDPVPLLVSLKAVDPQQYPFYGTVVLEPAGDLRQVLTDRNRRGCRRPAHTVAHPGRREPEDRRLHLPHRGHPGARAGPYEFGHGAWARA